MDVMRQIAGIALTLALLASLLWWLRRKGVAQWGRTERARMLEVIESRTICPGHTLHLVRVGDRMMALATHSGGCTLIDSRPWSGASVSPEVMP